MNHNNYNIVNVPYHSLLLSMKVQVKQIGYWKTEDKDLVSVSGLLSSVFTSHKIKTNSKNMNS